MTSMSSQPSDSDIVLGKFLKAYTQASNPKEVLESFIDCYPLRADSFFKLANANRLLDQTQHVSLAPAPLPKQLGEFELKRLIAVGGMGEIYEAWHERLKRRVAIKIIRRTLIHNEARDRFNREQCILARLHHTHILPIQTAGEEEDLQYFVMPYVNGAPLNRVLDAIFESSQKRGCEIKCIADFVKQIAEPAIESHDSAGTTSRCGSATTSELSSSRKLVHQRLAESQQKIVLSQK